MSALKSDDAVVDKLELEINEVPKKELDKREGGVPAYKIKCDYNEEQITRLKKEIFKGYQKLKDERAADNRDSKWDDLEAQYAGEMADDAMLEFNLSVPVTQVKCDAVERLSIKAFIESDPKFTVTPRPETAKRDKWSVTVNRQADYLDYKLDEEIKLEAPLRKVIHQAVLLEGGLLKIPYEYRREPMRREESYSAKVEQDERTGQAIVPGLISFLRTYPEAVQDTNENNWVVKDLMSGKDVTFKAEYSGLVYDDPLPQFVSIRDFFVSRRCEGYEGLCKEKLYIEREDYTWWELQKAEANGDFEDIEDAKAVINTDGAETDDKDVDEGDYKSREYEVIECNYWFNEKDSEDVNDEEKIICWFEAKSKAFLGAIYYPYDIVPCYYVPFYIKDKTAGFYKSGIAEDLKDSNLAQNALLNFMLTECWQQLMTTPIIKQGSLISDQFLSKRWKSGIPIEVPSSAMSLDSELKFLEKPQRAVAQQMMPLLAFLARYDDQRTGVTDAAATGRNDPTDPSAPASKTALLLQQSGINISDYIKCLLPSFNKVGEIILGLTYQMTEKNQGRPYSQRDIQRKVVGGDPFEEISRDDMIAKTNIQSRAAGFDFDKQNEKRENLALTQFLLPFMQSSPLYSQNIDGIYMLIRTLVQSWSPMWKNKVDDILSTPQAIQANTMKVAVQSLQLYMEELTMQSQTTGVEAKPQLKRFFDITAQLMSEATMPPQKTTQ